MDPIQKPNVTPQQNPSTSEELLSQIQSLKKELQQQKEQYDITMNTAQQKVATLEDTLQTTHTKLNEETSLYNETSLVLHLTEKLAASQGIIGERAVYQ